ncbi:MAG: hypothetical protein HOY76_21420 [Streptomyces sp.]|nr:hypothetical protein [Streptomyces sp.]
MSRNVWNPLYTLRWDTPDGERTLTGTSRYIHSVAPAVNRSGDTGTAWDIAVIDEDGTDVTGRFFARLDPTA